MDEMTNTSLTVNMGPSGSRSLLTPPASSMPSSPESGRLRHNPNTSSGRYKLRDLLADDQDFEDAQQAPAEFFSHRLKSRLALLYQAHRGGEASSAQKGTSDHVVVEASEGSVRDSPGPRRSEQTKAKKSTYDPWKRFRKLDVLSLDPWIQTHLDLHGSDPVKFLDDKHPLLIDHDSLEEGQIGNVFGACFEYTRQLERRSACDEFRWLFMMLLFHDIGIAIKPESRAEKVPGRFGKSMAEKTFKYFARAFEKDSFDVDLEDLKANLTKWSCIGRKLAYFCQQFGAGSLFFLRPHLKEYFLNKEISFNGDSFRLGHNHLTGLGLQQKAKDSGAEELASNIRHLTSRSFQQAAGISHPPDSREHGPS